MSLSQRLRRSAGIIDEEGQPIKITKMGGHKPTSPMGRLGSLQRPGSLQGQNSLRQGSTPRSLPAQSSTPRWAIQSSRVCQVFRYAMYLSAQVWCQESLQRSDGRKGLGKAGRGESPENAWHLTCWSSTAPLFLSSVTAGRLEQESSQVQCSLDKCKKASTPAALLQPMTLSACLVVFTPGHLPGDLDNYVIVKRGKGGEGGGGSDNAHCTFSRAFEPIFLWS